MTSGEEKKKIGVIRRCMNMAAAGLMSVLPVLAVTPNVSASSSLVNLEDGISSLTIVRNINKVSNKVENSFSYRLTLVKHPEGAVVSPMPEDITIDFTGTIPRDGRMSKSQNMPLSAMQYDRVGDYEFELREVSSTHPEEYPIDKRVYTVIAMVRNEIDPDGGYTGSYSVTYLPQVRNESGEKTDAIVFESAPVRESVILTKKVSGDMADLDRSVKFKLTLEGARDSDVFKVTGQDVEFDQDGMHVATNDIVSVGGDNIIYLKHGQSAKIGFNGKFDELPLGIKYKIEELGAEDYKTDVDGQVDVAQKVTATKTVVSSRMEGGLKNADYQKNMITNFVNKKVGSVKTGVVMNALPFVALAVGAVAIFMAMRKKKVEK